MSTNVKKEARQAKKTTARAGEDRSQRSVERILPRLLRTSFAVVPNRRPISIDGFLPEAPACDQESAYLENRLPNPNAGVPISSPHVTTHFLDYLATILEDPRTDFIEAVEELRVRHEECLVGGLAKLTKEGKADEQLWASVTRFFETARDPSTGLLRKPATFFWANTDDLVKDEEYYRRFSELIPKSAHFDQDELYSLMVFHDSIRSTVAYKTIGKLCEEARCLAVLDFGDLPWERAVSAFDHGGVFETLHSYDTENEHVMLVGNRVRVRLPSPYLTGDTGTWVNVGPIIAGAMVANDDGPDTCIALAPAGFKRQLLVRTMDGSPPELEWDISSTDEADKVRPLNPVVRIKDRLALWGISTLSLDHLRGQCTVVRVEEWLKKCLANFLQQEIFELDGGAHQRQALKKRIDGFFRRQSDPSDASKPFRGGEVVTVRRSELNPSHFDVDVRVYFKLSVTRFKVRVMKFVAVPSEHGEGFELQHLSTDTANA